MIPTTIISIVGLIVLFLVNYFIGVKRGFYKKGKENFWFGKIMHFFAGFFVAMFWWGFTQQPLFVVSLTLSIGIAWEIAEYLFGLYKLKKFGTDKCMPETKDTIEDLICDIVGAIVWVFVLGKILLE